MAHPQLFGIVPTGCPIVTTPSSVPAEASFIYSLPVRPFSHIVVFLLPGIALPPNTAAAVYLASSPPSSSSTGSFSSLSFKFLGGLGPGKESVIFKINVGANGITPLNGEVNMDAPEGLGAQQAQAQTRELILGISIEPSASVAAQMASLSNHVSPTTNEPSNTLALVSRRQLSTVHLAQKIIKNAFNFLASFSGNVPIPGADGNAGVEVVPLKAFEDWWKKFEGKLRTDPGFLDKDEV
jgi:protein Hikeshi